MIGRIYIVLNKINGKKYIGKTITSLKRRWSSHVSAAKCDKRLFPLHSAIRKYGPSAFDVREITTATFDDKNFLSAIERALIAHFKTKIPSGYNLTDGGDGGPGLKPSEETKEKLRVALKDRVFTPEHKERLRLAALGNKNCVGRKISKKHKDALSKARKGMKFPKVWRENISKGRKKWLSKTLLS